MVHEPFSPATAMLNGMPLEWLFVLIPLIGLVCFAWIMGRRIAPLRRGALIPDSGSDSGADPPGIQDLARPVATAALHAGRGVCTSSSSSGS
jgi:hypothetical protein